VHFVGLIGNNYITINIVKNVKFVTLRFWVHC